MRGGVIIAVFEIQEMRITQISVRVHDAGVAYVGHGRFQLLRANINDALLPCYPTPYSIHVCTLYARLVTYTGDPLERDGASPP